MKAIKKGGWQGKKFKPNVNQSQAMKKKFNLESRSNITTKSRVFDPALNLGQHN